MENLDIMFRGNRNKSLPGCIQSKLVMKSYNLLYLIISSQNEIAREVKYLMRHTVIVLLY